MSIEFEFRHEIVICGAEFKFNKNIENNIFQKSHYYPSKIAS